MPIPQKDASKGLEDLKSDPANDFYALDAHFSDTLELPSRPRAIRVGVGGTVIAVNDNGDDVTFSNVINGETLRIRAKQIKSTGTTATGLVGLI